MRIFKVFGDSGLGLRMISLLVSAWVNLRRFLLCILQLTPLLSVHSDDPDTYLVLRNKNEQKIKEKGSRFIARAIPVKSTSAAATEISRLRRLEYGATHHCSAYRIGERAEFCRSNDDGEPSGTAGAPILRQIEASGLTNTLIVVTRYFGGTKLGTGGLIRAYGSAAEAVLRDAGTDLVTRRTRFLLVFDYADTSPVMFTITQCDATIKSTKYGDRTRIEVHVKCSEAKKFEEMFTNALGGRGTILEKQSR